MMALFFPFAMRGQGASSDVLARVVAKASTVKTISADFVQEKELSILNDKMVSKGKMYYDGGMLRWEYLTPYRYLFVMNGSQVLLQSSNSTVSSSVQSNEMYREIAKIISETVTGKGLGDSSGNFTVKMDSSSKGNVAILTPRKGQMKKFFKEVRLHFGDDDGVKKVELVEATGDKTEISLTDIKYNTQIDKALFEIR